MDVTNLVANVAGPSNSATTVTAPVSNNDNNGKILSDSQAMALKRSDVIVEILKELVVLEYLISISLISSLIISLVGNFATVVETK